MNKLASAASNGHTHVSRFSLERTLPMKSMIVASAAAALALAAAVVTFAPGASASTSPYAPPTVAAGACFDQPNMAAALNQLRAARGSLGSAEHNKGGWRDNAIKAADNAIAETVRGCQFAK